MKKTLTIIGIITGLGLGYLGFKPDASCAKADVILHFEKEVWCGTAEEYSVLKTSLLEKLNEDVDISEYKVVAQNDPVFESDLKTSIKSDLDNQNLVPLIMSYYETDDVFKKDIKDALLYDYESTKDFDFNASKRELLGAVLTTELNGKNISAFNSKDELKTYLISLLK